MAATVSKKDLLLALLGHGSAYLQLDGRTSGVSLPDWLRVDPAVVLELGLELAIPIPDLVVDDFGVRATLSFRREPYSCAIPWTAVYTIADGKGRGALFDEDVPKDVDLTRRPDMTPPPQRAVAPAKKPPRPSHLKLVK